MLAIIKTSRLYPGVGFDSAQVFAFGTTKNFYPRTVSRKQQSPKPLPQARGPTERLAGDLQVIFGHKLTAPCGHVWAGQASEPRRARVVLNSRHLRD